MSKLLGIIIAVCFSLSINAQTTIYVSSESTSEGDGTIDNPFENIELALQRSMDYTGSDTLYICVQSGFYSLDKSIQIEQSPSVPIVIYGAADSKPILSGAIKLSSWEQTPEGLWKTNIKEVAKFGLKVEQLYVNGQRAIRARTPDTGWFFLQGSSEIVNYRGTTRSPEYATQRLLANVEDLATLKDMDIDERSQVMAMFYHKWDNTRKYLNFIQPDSGYMFLNGTGMKSWNSLRKGTRFVLENYKGALTAEGEWFLDKTGELYYVPRKGEQIEDVVAYAPVINRLLSIKGTPDKPIKNIVFRNISFAHSAYVMPIKGNDAMQAAAAINAAIHLDFVDNIKFEYCEIKHTGNYAIWFKRRCSNSSLKHSYLYDLGAGGVKIGEQYIRKVVEQVTNNIVIDNNIIQQAGKIFPCGVGVVIFNAANNRITHNEISDILYSGVSIGWMWGYDSKDLITTVLNGKNRLEYKKGHNKNPSLQNEVAYNHIHHIGWGELSDMGAVYTLGESLGTHIHHNVIHDIYSYDYGGWGLYTDEGSTGIVMENNLVYNCKSGGFHQHYGKDNVIRNNIFAFGHYYQLQFTRVEKHQSFNFTNNIVLMDHGVMLAGAWDKANINMDNNCYWDLRGDSISNFLNRPFKEWKKIKDKNSIVSNPNFKDPIQLDFSFKNHETIRKINFKPFDYENAGVYGSQEWKQKAKLPKERIDKFKEVSNN